MVLVPRRMPVYPLTSFRGGLNDKEDPSKINDDELADCENFAIDDGAIITAPGYAQWDDDPTTHIGPYWGGIMFKKADGTMVDVRQRQDTLEYSDDGSETWVECTLPAVGSPAATVSLTQQPCTFATLNDTVIWTNGYEDVMSSTDGITWTVEASLPKCKVVFNNGMNRLLYLFQDTDPFRIDWTDINAPTTIGASSYQLIDPNSNGFVIGAAKTPDGATMIFKENAIYTISDFVDNGIIDINFIGECRPISHQSIQTTEDSVIFASWDAGISEYIGGVVRTISGKLDPIGRNDASKGELYCSGYYNRKYHLSKPDATISTDYNAQEYIVYKDIPRADPVQPYAITRNKRYIGCYFIEDKQFDYGRDISLYIGDSRTDGSVFAFVNDYRSSAYAQGLNNEPQPAYFVTKYFTGNVSYYTKRIKKFFSSIKVENDLTVTLGYRFLPYGSWAEESFSFTTEDLNFEGDFGFSQGYGFSNETQGTAFTDIENVGRPRGVQFKISTNSVTDITFLDFAFSYIQKTKFK